MMGSIFIVSLFLTGGDFMRRTVNIQFKSYEMIERFTREIADIRGEFDLVSGRRVIDARSFLGIFSLDLSGPLVLNAVTDDPKAFEVFRRYAVNTAC